MAGEKTMGDIPVVGRILDLAPDGTPRKASLASPACPTCEGNPLLERFPRYEVVTYEPLRYCFRCHGFWARGDSLSRGVADPYSDHPALRSVPHNPRCKSCFGRIDDEMKCRKCREPLPEIPCPACAQPMKRVRRDSILLDICETCTGIWFETGELPALYGRTGGPPSLLARAAAASGADMPAPGEGTRGVDIADIVSVALMFLP